MSLLSSRVDLRVSLLQKLDVLKLLMQLLIKSFKLILPLFTLFALIVQQLSLFGDHVRLTDSGRGCRNHDLLIDSAHQSISGGHGSLVLHRLVGDEHVAFDKVLFIRVNHHITSRDLLLVMALESCPRGSNWEKLLAWTLPEGSDWLVGVMITGPPLACGQLFPFHDRAKFMVL